MKKFLAILLAIILIQIFNLINSSFEPLPDEKLQLINIVLVTIYSIVVLGLSIFFRKYPKIKEIVDKLMGIISLFVLVNLPLIFKITDMWLPLALLDVFLCIYYYKKYIKKENLKEIQKEEYEAKQYIADKYPGRHTDRLIFKFCIIIGYIVILIDLFNSLFLFLQNNIIYFILMLANICINLYIILKSKDRKICN